MANSQHQFDKEVPADLEEKKQGPNQQNALNNHLCFFKKGGVITAESIKAGLCKLGVTSPPPGVLSKVIMSEARLSGCPYATLFCGGKIERSNLPKLVHPFDTGIFKKENGTFNEEAFNKLASYAIVDKQTGQEVISLAEINKFKEKDSNPERWKNAGSMEKLIGFANSIGEFNLLFKRLSDANIDGVPYITITRLKRFYTEGYALFREIAAAEALKRQNSEKVEAYAGRHTIYDSIRHSCTIL